MHRFIFSDRDVITDCNQQMAARQHQCPIKPGHPEHRSKADRSETPAHYFNAIAVSITLSAFRWFLPNAGCECSFCVKAVKRLFYPDGVTATKIVPEARYQMWKAEDGWVKK